MSALRTPPSEPGPLRPWLARVVGNAVRQRARGEGRWARREQQAAREEALPSVAELTELAEAQQLLTEALLELDETRREVVLLRYFEGLSSAEIARRQGIPGATVRTRLKQGLEELRRPGQPFLLEIVADGHARLLSEVSSRSKEPRAGARNSCHSRAARHSLPRPRRCPRRVVSGCTPTSLGATSSCSTTKPRPG